MDLTPPPGIDLNASHQSRLYATYSSTYVLAVIAVALRLYCRLGVSKAGLWWDDYIICVALAMATGNFIDMIIWIHRGVGTHIYKWGILGVSHFYINLFVCEILYTLSLCLTKYSVLLFFWRIFSSSNMRIPIYILASVITAWGLGVILTTVFQCVPIQGLWDYSIKSHCGVDINSFFIGNAVPNIITDFTLLILPLPYVWRIQRNTVAKIALTCAFAMGGFICIMSIVRLVVMLESYKIPSQDVTWVFIGPSTWTAVETNIGIVSACLPSLRPLLSFTSRKSSRKETDDDDTYQLSNYYGPSLAKSSPADYEIHMADIDVTTSVDVDTYPRNNGNRFLSSRRSSEAAF